MRQRRYPIHGIINKEFDDLLVQATTTIPPSMFSKLGVFNTADAKDYKKEFLFGYTAGQYTKDGKVSWNEAKSRIDSAIRGEIICRHGGGQVEWLKINTNCFGTTYKYCLLPVYIGHSSYKEKHYNFYVNGGSGTVAGKAPVSKWKVFFLVAGIILGLGAIVLATHLLS
jgi:hypothetical protein